jgi:acyl dehydratase
VPGPTIIPGPEAVDDFVGKPLGVTDWITITQEQVNAFADATGDHQWIHVDVERARRESPWGGTIAHGYLTLSLAPVLMAQLVEVRGFRAVVNTGIDKLRLRAPIRTGSRVRMSAEIQTARPLRGGGVRVAVGVRFELEGEPRAAAVARVNLAYLP